MANFPRKADLIEQVQTAGNDYLVSIREYSAANVNKVSDYRNFNTLELNEQAMKRGNFIVNRMIKVSETTDHIKLLNKPLFEWNESLDNPVVYRVDNDLINSSDCFPPSLLILATDYVDQGYGYGDTIYDSFVKKAGALFLNSASASDFQIDAAKNEIRLHFPDPETSPSTKLGHIASGKLLYSIMQKGDLPAFDIHDITHHASQMIQYGKFYKWLTQQATDDVMYSSEKVLQKRLIRSTLLTTLEHSIVESETGVQSFGCLNWQAPHKSVLSTGVSRRSEYKVNDYPIGAQDINLWSGIRAIGSIYREQLEAQEIIGKPLNWMQELGYSMNTELLERIKPGTTYSYSDLTFDSARHASIKAPVSPEALFDNARILIESELHV